MNFSINKFISIAIILILIGVWIGAMFAINAEYESKYRDYLEYRDEVFDNAIEGVIRAYENFSNSIFYSTIDNDTIKDYLFQANHGDDEAKALMRERLASELDETHMLITKYNFRQFHFQLANGDSFYRFHLPEKFGDNLLDIRESMRIANLEQRYITGFEEGRIFSGYRFVYPLNYQGEHVGSIEISISPQCILEELYALDSRRDLGFMIAKDIMEETVFDDQQGRYHTSFISAEYVSDVEVTSLTEDREQSLKLHQNRDFVEELQDLTKKGLSEKDAISMFMQHDKKAYLIQFRPIQDISNRTVGYFYGFKEDGQALAIIESRIIVASLATAIAIILIFLVIYAYVRQREIQRLAMVDKLTGLYNRHSFYMLANREVARSNRNGDALTVAMLDIDFFKRVNDNYGHATGDDVLQVTAGLTKESIRATDILARFGGEEFVLLMPAIDIDKAALVAERIRSAVELHEFSEVGNITVSIGLSERIGEENINVTIARADAALYEAKASGRNKVCLA